MAANRSWHRWILAIAWTVLVSGFAMAQTSIVMWTFLNPTRESPREIALRQMIDDFQAANPDVQVVVEPQDFAIMPTKFFLGHVSGGNPDVVWIDAKNLGGLLQSGAGANLNELFIDGWSDEERADFYISAGWDAAKDAEGVVRAVPLFHGTTVLYYRKDLLAAAGIDPASIRTWDDLAAAAATLTVDNDGDGRIDVWGLGMPLSSERTEMGAMIHMMLEGIDPLIDATCQPDYANDGGVRALEGLAQFLQGDDPVTPSDSFVYNVDDVTEQFAAGRYAIAVASALRFTGTQAQAAFGGENMGILPWPTFDADRYPGAMNVSGWWTTVWESSPNKEAAARFVEYMVSQDGINLWSRVGGQVPIRTSVLADPYFEEPANAHMQVVRDSWAHWSWIEPTQCNTRTFQGDLNLAAQAYIQDGVDPMRALQDAERRFREAQ